MKKHSNRFIPKHPISKPLYFLLAGGMFILFILIWIILSKWFVKPFFLPSPFKIAKTTYELISQDLLGHLGASIFRVVLGWLFAVVLGVPLGILIGSYKIFEALFEPLNDFLRYMPVVAFIPLAILWLGIGDVEKIAIIFLGTFFQLVAMTSDISASVSESYIFVGRTLGYTPWQSVLRIVWPMSLPSIYDSLRVCMGWAWSYLVVAELVAAVQGIGYMIVQAQRFLRTDIVISGIIIIGLVGITFDYGFKMIYSLLFPWSEKK